MNLTSREVQGVAVVDLVGRLTFEGALSLRERVAGLISEGRTAIVLNLEQLSYMDSSGLGEMVLCHSRMQRVGGELRLAHTTARVHDLLTMTRLITMFQSYETEALALASLGAAGRLGARATARPAGAGEPTQ